MLAVVGEWVPSLSRVVTFLHDCSTAACEALVVICRCNEILLKSALGFTNSVALYLSAMLRLNASLRLALAGVLFSRGKPDPRRRSSCCTWPSSCAFGESGCSALCWGGGRPVKQRKAIRVVLHAVTELCRYVTFVCSTIWTYVSVVQ